tara:strand:- start:122 stop:535 length:414 start_codon:yes stop_codon:yes gene_type:complete
MDTIEKRIQAYLSKIPKQKVELGAVQDYNKRVANFNQGRNRTEKAITECLRFLRDFNTLQQNVKLSYKQALGLADSAEDAINEVVDLADKVARQARELGVDPKTLIDTKIVNQVSSLESSIQNFRANENLAKRITQL